MYQLPWLYFQSVSVCPAPSHCRRVEGFKRKRKRTASQGGLFNVSDLLRPVKLIQLLEPVDSNIAKRNLYGLHLARIVQTEEHDLLSGRQIGALHRRHRAFELLCQTQLCNCPADLRIHRSSERIADLTEYTGMDQRVPQDQ